MYHGIIYMFEYIVHSVLFNFFDKEYCFLIIA